MIATAVLLLAVLALTCVFVASKLYRRRRPGEPEVVSGHWLFGSSIDFSTNAVQFFLRCGKQYGEIFTIRLLHQYMTIVGDVHSYEALTKEKAFDFEPIQKQVNMNVFNMELRESKKMFKNVGKTVRGKSLVRAMTSFTDCLDGAIQSVEGNNNDEWKEYGLRNLTSQTMFTAIFDSIFGKPRDEHFTSQNVVRNFDIYHQYFNYLWLGLPHKLFPTAMKALDNLVVQPSAQEFIEREDTSDYIKQAIEFMQQNGHTEGDIKGHSLVYLHVNYNTFKVAFWCLYQILTHPEAERALREEIEEVLETVSHSNDPAEEIEVDQATLEGMKVLGSVIDETFRVSSGVFLVREVVNDVNFTMDSGQTHLIRKGDKVAMYPPAIHKDPEIFEDPEEFKYDRFDGHQKFYKRGKEIKNPLIAYGSLCPGKRYSLLQVKYFLIQMFNTFDFQLQEGQVAEYDYRYYGHEILPVREDVTINYRVRKDRRTIGYDSASGL